MLVSANVFKHPLHLLAALTLINLFNYLDRYILSAVLPQIQEAFALSHFQAGLLGTAFMLGYLFSSPLFGFLGDRFPRKSLIAAGIFLWSLATYGTGLMKSFLALLIMRALVGIGEASYAAISPTLIDDTSPAEKKTKRLSIFFMAIPVGAALGYVAGGFLSKNYGWQNAFVIAAVPGIFLSLYMLFFQEPKRQKDKSTFIKGYEKLLKNKTYLRVVAGYICYTFAMGGFAFWAPKFLEHSFQMPLHQANLGFGVITLCTGLIGTFAGGWIGSSFFKREGEKGYLRFSSYTSLLAFPIAACAIAVKSPTLFFSLCFVSELLLFASTGPVNAAILSAVPSQLRASAMALSIFSIHLLGDLFSPSLMGVIADHYGLRVGMSLFPIAVFLSGIIWFSPKAK